MTHTVSRLAGLVLPALLLASVKAGAATGIDPTCLRILTPTQELVFPRQLKLTREVVEHAMQDPRQERLLHSLSRIFSMFSPERVALLGYSLRGMPSADFLPPVPFFMNEFILEHPDLADKSVVLNYHLLYRDLWTSPLEPYDLGVMSVLFRGHPHAHMKHEFNEDLSPAEEQRVANRASALLARPVYRSVLAAISSSTSVRAAFKADMKRAGQLTPDLNEVIDELLDAIAERIQTNRALNDLHYRILYQILRMITYNVAAFANEHGYLELGFTEKTVIRDGFLALAEQYMLTRKRQLFSAAAMVDVLDYMYFESPLPTSLDTLYRMAIDSAKTLVLPMKGSYQAVLAERARQTKPTFPPPAGESKFEFRLIDFCAPVEQLPKRASKTRGTPAPSSACEPATAADPAEPLNTLGPLTSVYGPPTGKLQADFVYDFYFRRDEDREPQRATFAPEVIKWFGKHPQEQTPFLNALHFGWAGAEERPGIKEIWAARRRGSDRTFEIKTSGSYRALVTLEEGVWRVLRIVHKKDLKRAVEYL